MNITLEQIKADQEQLAIKIALFEKQASESEKFYLPETIVDLQPGEHYAGLITSKDGEPSYHLVLLPGEKTNITWDKAIEWVTKQFGECVASLPTRREQALLYANLKDQFAEAAYWSSEGHKDDDAWAWYQDFYGGNQYCLHKDSQLRARAVRRLVIE